MRCIVCDASDQGLSSFRADGLYHAKHFHEGEQMKFYCDQCWTESEGVTDDFNDDDLEREENDDAFEY